MFIVSLHQGGTLDGAKKIKSLGPCSLLKTRAWQFFVTFLGWLSDPFQWLSDLQVGDEKVTLNHLGSDFGGEMFCIFWGDFLDGSVVVFV